MAASVPDEPEKQVQKKTTITLITDARDYKGRPAVRASTGGWSSAAMILCVELNERLTTLGIAVNLVTYLTATMHLGGFLADTFLGRYLTIAIFTALQAAVRRRSSCAPPNGTQLGVLYLGLYLTALGTGGLKSSVSGFGSDQFDESDAGERRRMARFFSWFFFLISIGSLLAITVLVYVQDNIGRRWGYGVCVVTILAGLLLFLAGTTRYRFKKLAGSPVTQIAAVAAAAWRKRKLPLPSDPAMLYEVHDAAKAGKHKLPHSKQWRFLDHAAIVEETAAQATNKKSNRWASCTVTEVEEVKQVLRMLPTWATTILFWTVYAQMTTFSVSQAAAMYRRLSSTFVIPAGSLTVFFVAAIILTVPFYDRLLAPLARRATGHPHGLSPLHRIFVGLLLAALAMVAAALTERTRRNAASTPSVFLLLPQFVLVGAGEAFTYIGQLDFFLRECPKGMKTISTGLSLTALSLGFFLSTALVTVVHKLVDRIMIEHLASNEQWKSQRRR